MTVDFLVIGSGFGGSVSALRLAQKGYSVAVLEQGSSLTPERIAQIADVVVDGILDALDLPHVVTTAG